MHTSDSLSRRCLVAFLAVGMLVLAGCSGGDDGASSGGAATACEKDTRKDVYTAGVSKQASALSVKILDAKPGPPQKGTNGMMLQIADPAGKAIDGATVTVTPFMPDHGHGSAVTPVVTPMSGGKYDVSKVYLPMAGLWRLTVTVQMPGAAPQEVAFQFCVDG